MKHGLEDETLKFYFRAAKVDKQADLVQKLALSWIVDFQHLYPCFICVNPWLPESAPLHLPIFDGHSCHSERSRGISNR
jgi:hypothetical protein